MAHQDVVSEHTWLNRYTQPIVGVDLPTGPRRARVRSEVVASNLRPTAANPALRVFAADAEDGDSDRTVPPCLRTSLTTDVTRPYRGKPGTGTGTKRTRRRTARFTNCTNASVVYCPPPSNTAARIRLERPCRGVNATRVVALPYQRGTRQHGYPTTPHSPDGRQVHPNANTWPATKLTQKQKKQYQDDGYLLVSGIFTTDELDRMEVDFDAIIARRRKRGAALDATWPGDWKKARPTMEVIHTHDLQAYSAQWSRVLLHDRFTGVMADLIGPNVQLHHTKLFQKPPERGSAFPMHQDFGYFPHERHSMMAAVIHLTDATDEMGCLRVMPGSHKLGPMPPKVDGSQGHHYLNPNDYPIEKGTPCSARRGDVLLFTYLTIHGSGINTSNRVRKTVLVQVQDPSDRPTEQVHRSHAQGLMLRGINPLEGRTTAEGTLGAGVGR